MTATQNDEFKAGMELISRLVCEGYQSSEFRYNTNPEDLFAKTKQRSIAYPRLMIIFIANQMKLGDAENIAGYFGQSPETVKHAKRLMRCFIHKLKYRNEITIYRGVVKEIKFQLAINEAKEVQS
jgi:chromosomal replication initiation ATPase DnaA